MAAVASSDPPAARRRLRSLRAGVRVTGRPPGRPGLGRRLATVGLLGALGLALLLAVPGLAGVRQEITQINPRLPAVAVALELASDVSFVVLFRLFFDRLPARDARLLAWTEEGSGALLPGGGASGLAIGGWLIHLTGVPTGWIVRRSGALFLLSSAVNGVALIVSGLTLLAGVAGPHDFARTVLPAMLVALLALAVLALPRILRFWRRAPRWIRGISAFVQEAEQITFKHPTWRLLGALGYLGFDMAALAICLKAVGATPSFPALMMAYNIGYLANALPIPAGIGVVDAGLTGALVLYGVSATHAVAAVLVYRGIALWVPGLGGLVAYLRVRPRLTRPRHPTASTDTRDPHDPQGGR
jgi:uncharacterized membrane protein YbhN (UPF0104 family)